MGLQLTPAGGGAVSTNQPDIRSPPGIRTPLRLTGLALTHLATTPGPDSRPSDGHSGHSTATPWGLDQAPQNPAVPGLAGRRAAGVRVIVGTKHGLLSPVIDDKFQDRAHAHWPAILNCTRHFPNGAAACGHTSSARQAPNGRPPDTTEVNRPDWGKQASNTAELRTSWRSETAVF